MVSKSVVNVELRSKTLNSAFLPYFIVLLELDLRSSNVTKNSISVWGLAELWEAECKVYGCS